MIDLIFEIISYNGCKVLGVSSMGEKSYLIEIGQRIAKRRKDLNLTQEQVAEQVNLSVQSISCIELGKKAIRPINLVNLCRALNISCDYILTGEKTINELDGILPKIAILKDDDYKIVESLIDHLNKRS